ncbi:MAG: class I SAM-dependent methyltransferase [Candidatus Firestonebacteria bacterium]
MTYQDKNKYCAVDIEKCDTFDFMANVMELPVLHPGGFKATNEMANLCDINKDTKVLDIACAKGTNDCYLVEKFGCSVVGIDLDENLINQAKDLAKKKGLEDKLTFKVANAENIPLPDNEFDVVIFQAVLIMVSNQEKAIKEAIRVTKPHGYVGILEITWKEQPPKEFFKEAENICGFFQNAKTFDNWRKLIFGSGLTEIASKSYDMECPCGLSDLGLLKAIKIFCKQLFNKKIRDRMNELDNFVEKAKKEYFGYGIYVGKK